MALSVGTAVVVRTFGNKEGVIVAASREGRFQVRIGNVTMWCAEADLTLQAEPRRKKGAHSAQGPAPAQETAAAGRVDLHGLRVEEALERVGSEIDRSLLRGANRVEVVHGKGSGRIRDALHRYLAAMPVVAAFRLDPSNAGVTWVHFR